MDGLKKLQKDQWNSGVEGYELTPSHKNIKITTQCWTTIDQKKKNSGIYQNRYPTSKDQKEATTRCSWKSVSREDTFNTTGLLVRTVVLKAKDTGSNLKSIKKEANDRLWPSLALDDLRCPCNHSAAAAVRSQHPHTELARDWRSSLHADWEEELTTHVRILAELRRHERGGTGCGICWRALWRMEMRTPGSTRGPRWQGHKVEKTECSQPVSSLYCSLQIHRGKCLHLSPHASTEPISLADGEPHLLSCPEAGWRDGTFASNFNNKEH